MRKKCDDICKSSDTLSGAGQLITKRGNELNCFETKHVAVLDLTDARTVLLSLRKPALQCRFRTYSYDPHLNLCERVYVQL